MNIFFTFLPIILIALYAIMGYWLLRTKGYRGWWNLLLLSSPTPLFWIIGACLKTRDTTKNTTTISALAGVWAIINLFVIWNLQDFRKARLSEPTHFVRSNDVSWTTQRKDKLKGLFNRQLSTVGMSSSNIDQVVDCMVEKVVLKFPAGIDFGRTTPEIDSVFKKIGYECGRNWDDVTMEWTPAIEKLLLENLIKNMKDLDVNESKKRALADCILEKLKSAYPRGLKSRNQSKDDWEKEMSSNMVQCLKDKG